jgi:hypothetical protein
MLRGSILLLRGKGAWPMRRACGTRMVYLWMMMLDHCGGGHRERPNPESMHESRRALRRLSGRHLLHGTEYPRQWVNRTVCLRAG